MSDSNLVDTILTGELDAPRALVRLECLRLAANRNEDGDCTVERADAMYRYVMRHEAE